MRTTSSELLRRTHDAIDGLALDVRSAADAVDRRARFREFSALHFRWDDNAYASITWLLLSLHTIHIATDVVDTAVLTTLFWTGPVTKKRFVDASENSLYWYFIIAWWIPIYLVIYWAPRWL